MGTRKGLCVLEGGVVLPKGGEDALKRGDRVGAPGVSGRRALCA